MTPIEAAELLTMLAATNGREPTAAEAQGWAWALDDVPIEVGREALHEILRNPDAGYITPQKLRRHTGPALARLARDVRSAKLRHLVDDDWPADRPLPPAARAALAAEWEAMNDREELGSSATPARREVTS